MAYIVRKNEGYYDEAITTTYTPTLPAHQSGDLLLIAICVDTGNAAAMTNDASWTFVGTQATNGGIRHLWAYKIAASSSETVTFTAGAASYWNHFCYVINDHDASTPIDGSAYAAWSSVSSFSSPSFSTSTDGCLVFYSSFGDNYLYSQLINSGNGIGTHISNVVGDSGIVYFYSKRAAGAVPTVDYLNATASEGGQMWVVAVKNATSGDLSPTASQTIVPAFYNSPFDGGSTPTVRAPDYFGTTTINSITMSSTTPTIVSAYANVPIGFVYRGMQMSGGEATECWSGGWIEQSSARDLSNKILYVNFSLTTLGIRNGAEGLIYVFRDSSGNWAALNPLRKSDAPLGNSPQYFVFDTRSTSFYASSGTLDWSDITQVGIFNHRSGYDTAITSHYTGVTYNLRETILINGDPSDPIDQDTVKSFLIGDSSAPYAGSFQGSGQGLIYSPITFGDGASKTYVDMTATSVETPVSTNFNVSLYPESVTIKINASANDTMIFKSSIFNTASKQIFEVASGSSASATYDFSAMTLIGWVVNWNGDVDIDSITFSGCYLITASNSIIMDSVFSGSLSTTYCLALTAACDVTGCEFTKGAESYAIEIQVAGDYDFSSTTFTGYTTELYVSAATGTVNITLAAGQTVPGYTSAGATVNFVLPTVSATATVVAGSTVQLYNVTQATELDNSVEATTSYSYTISPNLNDVIRLRVAKIGYLPVVYSAVYSGASIGFVVEQVEDTVYTANAIDGSTVTEFAYDGVNVQIDVNDPDGETTIPRGYAWYCYFITTATGIADGFGAFEAIDESNYRINTDIADFQIENVSSPTAPVRISGGYLFRSDGGQVCATTGGTIIMDPGKAYIASSSGLALEASVQTAIGVSV